MVIVRKIAIILLGISFLISAEGNSTNKKYNGFQILSGNNNKINFINPGYEIVEKTLDNKNYLKPEIKNSGSMVSVGEPYLPSVNTFYAVEPGKSYTANVTILNSELITDVDILPLETWDNELTGSVEKSDVYNQNKNFPVSFTKVSEPIVMRNMVMVQVSMTPFQYNPVSRELTIIHDAEVELVESGDIEMPFIPSKRSRAFDDFLEALVVNYESLSRNDDEYQRPSILYVLPNNIGNLLSTVEPLMDWKRRMGYEVNYISSSTVVNNRNNLKAYIEDAYENWDNPPVHVNIVADAEGSYDVPTWTDSWSGYNGEGDHPYSLLEGNDQFPEVFIGRLSFDTSSDLQTIISKTINYESNPYMNENWFQRACLVGDPSTSGISCVITNEHIHEILDVAGFEEVNTVYSGSFPGEMQSGISDGVAFFNYRGYYGVSGFTSNNVNNTNNGFMLPVATVITCGTGSFASEEALIESFIRAGTSANPRGSVVCIGTATLGTHTMFNNIVGMGFYYGAMIKGIETVGAALMYGKMMLHQNYPSNPNNYADIFTHWNNLMGESSLQMWTEYPQLMSVTHPYAVNKGTNYIDINVTIGLEPVKDSWVTIYMEDEMIESGYTNSAGFVRLPISTDSEGEVHVTITKQNHYPYQNSFQIYDPGVAVNVSESTLAIDDDNTGDSNGNSNGSANGGETIELYISAKNYGDDDASGISGVLVSGNTNATIINNTISYGAINSGETVSAPTPFVIQFADGLQEGADLDLIVTFLDEGGSTSSGLINLNISGNNLFASNLDVLGTVNDILNPGQSSYLKIQLSNIGSTSASNITGTITCASPFIEIIDNTGIWNSIMNGGAAYNNDDYFEVSALDETIPGAIAHLILNLETSDGYTTNSVIEIQIGEATVYDPVGPDAHGYYIYDSGDIEYLLAPAYNWVEIDDRYGGSGSHLSSLTDSGNNQDDVETINLPFTFTFYGQEYNQISICSNGWLSMGDTDMESFRNYQIPGVGGPAAMVAVFWDDLKLTNNGRVYTWYDEENRKFYIQWSRVRTYQNNDTETFQAVLMDPDYYNTPTGDGEILMQYNDFNNTSYGSYSWDQIHGDYCTVGIEDHTMTVGLQYTFNDGYHPAGMEIEDGVALLITTRGSDIRLDGDLNYDQIVNVYDILLLVDFILGEEGNVNAYFADINNDGMVNIMDMVRLIQMVMEYGN